jgi:hypothetical protein
MQTFCGSRDSLGGERGIGGGSLTSPAQRTGKRCFFAGFYYFQKHPSAICCLFTHDSKKET